MAVGHLFGNLADGTPIHEVGIRRGDLSASVITYGAVIRDLVFQRRPLVLGFETLDNYIKYSPHFGAIAGRYANRIAAGHVELDGAAYQLSLNEGGKTHLHGGFHGFGRKPWRITDLSEHAVQLRLVSPDGEEGYPGEVEVTCQYSIDDDNCLRITLEGRTDRPTILNLAGHSYFNLDDTADTLSHLLEIPASHYTPVNAQLIPTGEIASVENSSLDFRVTRPVRDEGQTTAFAYDHNFVIAREQAKTPHLAARLTGPATRTCLEVRSTEPGLQFYDGSKLNVPVAGLGGRRYGPHAGLCLEPQLFPDTPNHANFGSAILRPGETYRQITEYRLSRQ